MDKVKEFSIQIII